MGHLISIAFPTLGNLTKNLGPRVWTFAFFARRNGIKDEVGHIVGHVAALVRSHAIGLLPFRLTKEQTTQTMDPSPKTIELLHYAGQ